MSEVIVPLSRVRVSPDAEALSWLDAAACASVDPELFFPETGRVDQAAAARRVCASCPVVAECLELALANGEEFGIWGGLSDQERQRVRRNRSRQGLAA